MDFAIKRTFSISSLANYVGRIIVVSNRLPVNATYIGDKQSEGASNGGGGTDTNNNNKEKVRKWSFKMSSGGLVAGLEVSVCVCLHACVRVCDAVYKLPQRRALFQIH